MVGKQLSVRSIGFRARTGRHLSLFSDFAEGLWLWPLMGERRANLVRVLAFIDYFN